MSLAAHLLHRVQLILLMFYGVEVHELPLLKSIVYLLYFLDFTFFSIMHGVSGCQVSNT